MVMCFAPDCKHYSERDRCRFFRFPKDETSKRIWIKNIRRADRFPSNHSKVCSCHFKDSNKDNTPTIFIRNETKSIFESPKIKNCKRYANIPERFPGSSNCFTRNIKVKNNLPAVQNLQMQNIPKMREVHFDNIRIKSNDDTWKENIDLRLGKEENSSCEEEYFTYDKLLENIRLIRKPNYWWSVTSVNNFIICARWNAAYIAEKRVVIENTLTVRVFLKEMEVNITDLMDITSVEDISSLLMKVETYNI